MTDQPGVGTPERDDTAWDRLPTPWRALTVGVAALTLYAPFLGWAPIYLAHDEVVYALNAHAVATSGRGMSGEPWPLYFHVGGTFWATPLVVYWPALFLSVLPISPAAVRLPTAILGALSVTLMYLIARRVFTSERRALVAAALLATTPAFFLHSRLGVDHLYPVPLVLGWFLCVLRYLERERQRDLFAAASLLGVGVYSYLGSVAAMPLYFALTVLLVCLPRREWLKAGATATAGFAWPLLPLIPWVRSHPDQYWQQLAMYRLSGSEEHLSPLRGLLRQFNYPSIVEHVRVYHEFFNPSYLFFTGDSSVIDSTRASGVFLAALAPLIVLGVNEIVNFTRNRVTLLVLAACLVAPVAAVFVGEVKVNRALTLLPFAVLIAVVGYERLMGSGALWRRVTIGLLLLALAQFAYFAADYFTGYRVRSSLWFEGNRRGAFAIVLEQDRLKPIETVLLSESVPWIEEHWRLYLIEHGRQDLLARTRTFKPQALNIEDLQASSVLIANVGALSNETLDRLRARQRVIDVTEPSGEASFIVVK